MSEATALCIHDLTPASCADCRPRPSRRVVTSAGYGPWFAARFDGECADGGEPIFAGDQIRSDGEGGWLCTGCGGP